VTKYYTGFGNKQIDEREKNPFLSQSVVVLPDFPRELLTRKGGKN
jgi:hypothetical protein